MERLWRYVNLLAVFALTMALAGPASTAPYAAMVIDARSGKVLHSRNADTRLHPASLTKMMTLYVVFDAVRRGEISLDTQIKVSKNAAAEPPSKLYLKAGQRIKLRYLIRASAVKSANDAATAMAEAVSGSEAAFTKRMTRTARALGMSKTTFKNAHGLTMQGHLSTARDMTTLGRALFYHYPEYYNLFSRRTTHAGVKEVHNTNRRLLNAYKGADGIKTGYTRAAGFNLVASAERGKARIIATMFGGTSGSSRNKRVAELLDMGFSRAPKRAATRKPRRPNVSRHAEIGQPSNIVVTASIRPTQRPTTGAQVADATPSDTAVDAATEKLLEGIEIATAASTAAIVTTSQETASAVEQTSDAAQDAPLKVASIAPKPRPAIVTFSASEKSESAPEQAAVEQVLVSRVSASGGRHWAINVGTYNSQYEAERVLLKTALVEIETLDVALRKVVRNSKGFDANFVGLDERSAALACQRLTARQTPCQSIGPGT